MNDVTVIKIGGNIIDDPVSLQKFLHSFSKEKGARVLIHGGGKKASELSRTMGVEPRMIEGRRITDAATLEIVTMVYAGLINKNIVAQLQSLQVNALGLTGADLNLIKARKRENAQVDYGFVGDFVTEDVNTGQLSRLLENGITPVFCALTHDMHGSLLNTNADSLAAGIAIALSEKFNVHLHLCFEKPGVLRDAENDKSVILQLDKNEYLSLKSAGKIFEGMIPKLDNAFKAFDKDVDVTIRHALDNSTGTKLIRHE